MAKQLMPHKKSQPISIRLTDADLALVKDLAALLSLSMHEPVSIGDVIRDAIQYVHKDGTKMRELFATSRRVRSQFKVWKNRRP